MTATECENCARWQAEAKHYRDAIIKIVSLPKGVDSEGQPAIMGNKMLDIAQNTLEEGRRNFPQK